MISLDYAGEPLYPAFGRYEGGRAALQMLDGMDLPYATITVNLPEDLAEGEHFVKGWSENEPIVKALLDAGWLRDTGRRVQTGYVEAMVCEFAGPLEQAYEQEVG